MLPTLVHKPFSNQGWLFEPKWDGWRTTCFIKDGQVRFVSRRRNSLSERFPQLNNVSENIKANTAVLDGEIVAFDKDGLPRFDALRSRRTGVAVVFYAFDLLHLGGFNLADCSFPTQSALEKYSPRKITRAAFASRII